jgi:hypothetical protein
LKKGKPLSPSFLMKRPRAAIIPVSFMTSFLLDHLAILRIASTFVGLTSMPWCPTMKPRDNPKRHTEDALCWVELPLELS